MAHKLAIVALALSLCLILPIAQSTDFSYCTKRLYEVKVKGVKISPNPVVRGQAATFSISASTDDEISGGKLDIEVSYFGVHIHTERHDLCEESSCPIKAGDFTISHSQVLPGYTPPGSYTLRMTMYDEEHKSELTCIRFNFKIGLGSSVADT